MAKVTFLYILGEIRHDSKEDILTEDPISAECRLAICLYRPSRGETIWLLFQK